jgi:N-acetylmuramoyl-L-alanine amidase
MAFDAELIHWPTITAFDAYLQGVPRPSWCRRLCNHNTYKPDETTWRGMTSMQNLVTFYRDTQQWPSGPHLFLAAHAPNPADTGIFQLTPITHPGTHAGACNADSLGLENVGNFNDRPPTNEQYTLLLTVNRLLLAHWGIPPASVVVHNECMSGRTCPGKYLTGTQIRADLSKPPPIITKRYTARHMYISQKQEGGEPYAGELLPGEEIVADKWYTNGRVHLQDGRGFVLLSDLEPV